MGKNTRKPVLKIRYRKPGKTFGVKFTFSRNGGKKLKGRVLSMRKLSREQINRVGEYTPFDPDELARELQEKSLKERQNATI